MKKDKKYLVQFKTADGFIIDREITASACKWANHIAQAMIDEKTWHPELNIYRLIKSKTALLNE